MKPHILIVKEEARNEISEAFYWYESKQQELGSRFISVLDDYFDAIIRKPKQFPKQLKNMRRATIRQFPYIIVLEVENKEIVIYAVFNTNQNPEKWQSRGK